MTTTSEDAPKSAEHTQQTPWAQWHAVVVKWWEALQERPGWRAGLARCGALEEVMMQPGYVMLRRDLGAAQEKRGWPGWMTPSMQGAALIAGVLAHVRDNKGGALVEQLATSREGSERALMSALRFRRLLAYEEPEEVLVPMARAVRLVGRAVDVGALAQDLCCWTYGGRVQRQWAERYYTGAVKDFSTKTESSDAA